MAFGRKGGDAPRVVGFDFGPPVAAPPLAPEPAPTPEVPVAAEYPPPAYPPPAYPPPAYEPPRSAPEALDGYLAPVSTMAPPAPAQPVAPQADEAPPQQFWRPGAEIPPGWSDQVALPRKRRTTVPVRGIVSLVVTGLVAMGGYRTYQKFFGDPFTRPAAIGEYALLTTTAAENAAAEMRRDMIGEIGRPVAGMYGRGGAPEFIVVAGDGSDRDTRDMYATLAKDLGVDKQAVSAATPVKDVVCATVAFQGEAVVCFWASKGGADGVVFHFGSLGMAETGRVASLAKAAIT